MGSDLPSTHTEETQLVWFHSPDDPYDRFIRAEFLTFGREFLFSSWRGGEAISYSPLQKFWVLLIVVVLKDNNN